MKKLAVVLMAVLTVSWVYAERDITADIHLHTNKKSGGFSDGLKSPVAVFNMSRCRVVVFTDHLDGVTERGTDLYLNTIRALTTDSKLAIPGIEVTCGSGYSAYDVLAIGLNNQSLSELSVLLKKGAFIDPENGLPALKVVAGHYNLILIAAHPDSTAIPFNLTANAQYVDGFEMYDSKHIGFSADRFGENCAPIYKLRDKVAVTAGSDYHYFLSGALPTRSPLEAPVTHIILDNGAQVSETNVLDSLRRGRTYAASLIGAAIANANQLPGGVWRPGSDPDGGKLKIGCSGLDEGSLLYQNFNVIASNGQQTRTMSFRPQFNGGKAWIYVSFDQLRMPDAKAINVDFGGRLVTSTIKVEPPTVAAQNPIQTSSSTASTDQQWLNKAAELLGRLFRVTDQLTGDAKSSAERMTQEFSDWMDAGERTPAEKQAKLEKLVADVERLAHTGPVIDQLPATQPSSAQGGAIGVWAGNLYHPLIEFGGNDESQVQKYHLLPTGFCRIEVESWDYDELLRKDKAGESNAYVNYRLHGRCIISLNDAGTQVVEITSYNLHCDGKDLVATFPPTSPMQHAIKYISENIVNFNPPVVSLDEVCVRWHQALDGAHSPLRVVIRQKDRRSRHVDGWLKLQ